MASQDINACRVLVVDDFPVMRRTIISILKLGLNCTLEFVEAGDGTEALAAYQPAEFDLIISDWQMPNMDGLEFVKNVRSVDCEVPILMTTSEAQKERVIEALRAGVTDYLIKPFTQQMLLEKCGKYLIRKPARKPPGENTEPSPTDPGNSRSRPSATRV